MMVRASRSGCHFPNTISDLCMTAISLKLRRYSTTVHKRAWVTRTTTPVRSIRRQLSWNFTFRARRDRMTPASADCGWFLNSIVTPGTWFISSMMNGPSNDRRGGGYVADPCSQPFATSRKCSRSDGNDHRIGNVRFRHHGRTTTRYPRHDGPGKWVLYPDGHP